MGQRFQMYIHTVNPYDEFIMKDQSKIQQNVKLMFGIEKTTVLSWYNQWCYGGTAVSVVFQVLNYLSNNSVKAKENEYENLNRLEFARYRSLKKYLSAWEGIICTVNEPIHPKCMGYRLIDFFLLNEDDNIYRLKFDECDNDDGVCIIDHNTMRYCFMNINPLYPDGKDLSIYPQFKPISAGEYVKSYYPGDQENNQKVTEAFSPFELLTIAEVKAIFPAMVATIDKHYKPGKSSTNGSK